MSLSCVQKSLAALSVCKRLNCFGGSLAKHYSRERPPTKKRVFCWKLFRRAQGLVSPEHLALFPHSCRIGFLIGEPQRRELGRHGDAHEVLWGFHQIRVTSLFWQKRSSRVYPPGPSSQRSRFRRGRRRTTSRCSRPPGTSPQQPFGRAIKSDLVGPHKNVTLLQKITLKDSRPCRPGQHLRAQECLTPLQPFPVSAPWPPEALPRILLA